MIIIINFECYLWESGRIFKYYWNRLILRGSAFLARGGRLSDNESYVTTEFIM